MAREWYLTTAKPEPTPAVCMMSGMHAMCYGCHHTASHWCTGTDKLRPEVTDYSCNGAEALGLAAYMSQKMHEAVTLTGGSSRLKVWHAN